VTGHILVYAAKNSSAAGVETRGIITSHVGLPSWTCYARVTQHTLIRTADHGITTCIIARGVVPNHVGFTCWAVIALVTALEPHLE
jgi:hypothetical protein